MTKINTIRFIFIMLCISLFSGCSKSASEEIDFGTIQDSIYFNEYFGLTVEIPVGWSVQDQKARQQIMKTGTDLVAGGNKNLKAMTKAAELQTVSLFMAFELPIGTPTTFNPSISGVAERVRDMPGIKRGEDYHSHSRKLLESSPIDVTFPQDISTETLGGIDFDILHVQIRVPGVTVQQKHYATIMKGYALIFIVSYISDIQKATLDAALNSILIDS